MLSSLTKSSGFSLLFARDPNIPSAFPQSGDTADTVPHPIRSIDDWMDYQRRVLSVIYPSISQRILYQKEHMVSKLNKTRRIISYTAFPIGSEVMIKDPQFLSEKSHKGKKEASYIGPYVITRKDQNGNFILKDTDGVELNRHVPPDQLKPRNKTPSPNDNDNIGDIDDDIYEVDHIIDHRGEPGKFEYRVKWKGYPESQSTWEFAHNFMDTQCIRDYWNKIDKIEKS
jgi:hypothetical protein